MGWYGTVWFGMVWYGMVWYDLVWYGMVWYGLVWYGRNSTFVILVSKNKTRYVKVIYPHFLLSVDAHQRKIPINDVFIQS